MKQQTKDIYVKTVLDLGERLSSILSTSPRKGGLHFVRSDTHLYVPTWQSIFRCGRFDHPREWYRFPLDRMSKKEKVDFFCKLMDTLMSSNTWCDHRAIMYNANHFWELWASISEPVYNYEDYLEGLTVAEHEVVQVYVVDNLKLRVLTEVYMMVRAAIILALDLGISFTQKSTQLFIDVLTLWEEKCLDSKEEY